MSFPMTCGWKPLSAAIVSRLSWTRPGNSTGRWPAAPWPSAAAVEIEDMPGAFPYYYDQGLKSAVLQAVGHLVRQDEIVDLGHTTGSTDIGDLSMIMPVIQPFIGGVSGGLHQEDYRIADPDTAYLLSAKLLAGTAAVLLSDDAAAARLILKRYKPAFSTRAALIRQLDSLYAIRSFSGADPRLADIWQIR